MLAYNQQNRCTLDEVIASPWFLEMEAKLRNDKATLEKTYKSIFQKLGYVMNLTKIKLDMKELRLKADVEQANKISQQQKALINLQQLQQNIALR